MKKIIYIPIIASLMLPLASCDDYLDTTPDNRVTIDSPEKVRQLLVSAYSDISPVYLLETMSDNMDLNVGNYGSYSQTLTQTFEWQDINSVDDHDNPNNVWSQNYAAIATANVALEAIGDLGGTPDMNPHKGEALLSRAYHHFVLVTTFSKMYGVSSDSDAGIPYITAPEKTVKPNYNRETVSKTYEKIAQDLEDGIKLIDNGLYKPSSVKYHFNKNAANAFAARFYLYYRKYDKAIYYANQVLGEDPIATSRVLRNWSALGATNAFGDVRGNTYIDATSEANLLLMSTSSVWVRIIFLSIGGSNIKYSYNGTIANNEATGAPGPWGAASGYYLKQSTFVVPPVTVVKLSEYFEIKDPVTQTGYVHVIFPTLTTDETLLVRAEAYALSGQYQKSVDDLNTFLKAFYSNPTTLTEGVINNFYDNISYYTPKSPTPKKELHPDAGLVIQPGYENLIHTILQLRRVMFIHEGLRWHDMNRYGIKMYRRSVNEKEKDATKMVTVTDSMEVNDPRRAIQLPQDVISAGLAKNPR